METDSLGIGQEIRRIRRMRGLSLEVVAQRAGFTKGYLSRIENGVAPLERRSTLTAFAKALECSVADFGVKHVLVDPADSEAQGTLPAIRHALISTSLDDSDEPPSRAPAELSKETRQLAEWRQECRYVDVGRALPTLLTDLHAVSAEGGDQRRDALRNIVQTAQVTTLLVKNLGAVDLAWVAAERGHEAAVKLDEPLWIAAAEFARTQALVGLGAYKRAEKLARKAASLLDTSTPESIEVYGTSILTAAFCSGVLETGNPEEALREATELAAHTPGTNAFFLAYSRTNVDLWRISIALEADDAVRAADVAARVRIEDIPARSRKVAFLIDHARALHKLRGHDSDVLQLLRKALKLGPTRTSHSIWAREIIAEMLNRAHRDAGGRALRGLAERMGILQTV
ncbi:helix-turn-helix domain-containing protein [Actinosynnema sp. CS-041913]|uniref:helix-turn-helix domain-containing protein n=1 Tax=Actinosynnema sp. CS-041913 TaxID=3239917 RepID=UPI003D92AEC4